LEPHPQLYIDHLVEVCREIKRILSPDGSFYLNLGDAYYASGGKGSQYEKFDKCKGQPDFYRQNSSERSNWLQPKQKLMIPARAAIALQEEGWILRNEIVWWKPNHMPGSQKDRLTCAWEPIFHFVKRGRYYYDLDASKGRGFGFASGYRTEHPLGKTPDDILRSWGAPDGRYEGQATKDYDSAGAQNPSDVKRRIVQGFLEHPERGKNPGDVVQSKYQPLLALDDPRDAQIQGWWHVGRPRTTHERGRAPEDFWRITTKPFKEAHFAVFPPTLCVRPILSSCPPGGVVFDPFAGAGTALCVAKALGRRWLGCDLKAEYVEMAERRIARVAEPLAPVNRLAEALEAAKKI